MSSSVSILVKKFVGVNQLIPHLKKTDIKLHQALGSISDTLVGVASLVTAKSSVAATSTGDKIYFSIPGTLGIQSDAAPLAISSDAINWTSIVAVVKQAPVGAPIAMVLRFAGAAVATFYITDGNTQVTIDFFSQSQAGDIITIDITSVGLTFPGSDLTIQLQS